MEQNKKQPGMLWHKFIILCLGIYSIWIVLDFVYSVVTAFSRDGGHSPSIYLMLPIFFFITLSFVCSLRARKYLKRMRKGAFSLLFSVNMSIILCTVACNLSNFNLLILGDSVFIPIILNVIFIVINAVYYKKRKDMFVN